MKIYEKLDEIPVFNFFKIFNNVEKNINYIYKKSKGEKLLPKSILFDTFDKLQNDYLALTFTKSNLQDEKLKAKVTYLTGKINIIELVLDSFLKTHDENIFLLLNEFREFKLELPITTDDVKEIQKQKTYITNKINLSLAKFKLKHKAQLENEIKGEDLEKDLDKQALSLESYLELGYNLNIKKISMLRWINLRSMAEEKNERIKNI